MELDLNKIFRIGLDKISIYNFKIKDGSQLLKSEKTTDYYTEESFYLDDEMISLNSSTRFYSDGRTTHFQVLIFNPNKILHSHNIYNADKTDLMNSIIKLIEILRKKGIELDLSDARVRSVEINKNYDIHIKELIEALTLLFISFDNSVKISNGGKNKNFKKIYQDNTFLYSKKTISFQAYCKTSQVNDQKLLDKMITRIELELIGASYRNRMSKHKLDDKLSTLTENYGVIELIFKDYIKNIVYKRAVNYIEENIKPTLESEYLAYKKSNASAAKIGKKQRKGVYRHLAENYWLFDYLFLYEIVDKHEKKNKNREKKTIEKRLSNHNNLEKLNYLMDFIFPQ
ncbi:hypothetical protein [Ilyobacter polytropus]|uniref:Uncharacterized protein n=1 Tax=Ilyobacter polytropus (strain ATCC 51220 / DSM 2926 / LMG 16218 / CuHBu1) TaxID=572544 RepID=E3HBN0_ILYPC|nr:hypothetical protein [Ilyobacter polytropus]ADO83726.1 hypothetical protein Ilyop_1955 [Ilyobacter polytropus DSM 2926]